MMHPGAAQMMMPGMSMPMMSAGRGRGKASTPMMPGMVPAMMMPGTLPMTMGMVPPVPPARAAGPAAANVLAPPWMMQQQTAAASVHDLLYKPGSSNRSSSAMPAKAKGNGQGFGMPPDKFPVKVHCLEHIKEFCFSEAVECMTRNWAMAWNPATLPGLQPQDIIYCWLVGWDLTPGEPVPSGTTKSQWQLTMSYLYQSKGFKLQNMTMEQVREQGRIKLAEYEADVVRKQEAYMAQCQAMHAQNMAMFQSPGMQACQWPAGSLGYAGQTPGEGQTGPAAVLPAVPAHAPVPVPEACNAQAQLITTPDGRTFIQVQERSRFLSRQQSGGADDWALSPGRSTLVSPSKSLAAAVMDVVTDESGQGGSWHPAPEPEPAEQKQTMAEYQDMLERVKRLQAQELELDMKLAAKRRRLEGPGNVAKDGPDNGETPEEEFEFEDPAIFAARQCLTGEESGSVAEQPEQPSLAAGSVPEQPDGPALATAHEKPLTPAKPDEPLTPADAHGNSAEQTSACQDLGNANAGKAHASKAPARKANAGKADAGKATAGKAPAMNASAKKGHGQAPANAAPKAGANGVQTTLLARRTRESTGS